MFQNPYFVAMLGACAAVIVVLLIGVLVFGRGGPNAERNAQRMMRLRIVAQAFAIGLILLFILMRHKF